MEHRVKITIPYDTYPHGGMTHVSPAIEIVFHQSSGQVTILQESECNGDIPVIGLTSEQFRHIFAAFQALGYQG